MSEGFESAAHVLVSLFWYVWWGAVFCFWGEKGLPCDPPLFIYFLLSLACWVKGELKLREPWLRDEGLSHYTHTRTDANTHRVLLWASLEQETLLTSQGPFRRSSYGMWQPLETPSLCLFFYSSFSPPLPISVTFSRTFLSFVTLQPADMITLKLFFF